jgi:hypothetical protein
VAAPAVGDLGTVALTPVTVVRGADATFPYRVVDSVPDASHHCMLVIRTEVGEPYAGFFRIGLQPANTDLAHVRPCELLPGTYRWWIRLSELELGYACEPNSLTVTSPDGA